MSEIRIPAGESLRAVANRLGVEVEKLQAHTDIRDVEAPQPIAKRIEVPDGFLRERDLKVRRSEARHVPQELKAGMNMWLALDIEQKRTRSAGGLQTRGASGDEGEALIEARRAYLRFEMLSNELAIDLYRPLTSSRAIDVRAEAFAGLAMAEAQEHRLFGAPWQKLQPAALSSAKAALLADPKLAASHLAFGLALDMGEDAGSKEAFTELERAVALAPSDPWALSALASIARRRGDLDLAQEAASRALEHEAACPFALETLAELALAEDALDMGLGFYRQASAAIATYANAELGLAVTLKRLGRQNEAQAALEAALGRAENEAQREHLTACFDGELVPYV